MTTDTALNRPPAVRSIDVNGRRYALPVRPTVVICLDGFDPEYLYQGIADGVLPTIAGFKTSGYVGSALSAVPTTTNTNNTSIVTGVPPSIHGINGNYYLDQETGEEIMIADAARLRCGTIFAAMNRVAVTTATVTAKDKLLKVLAHEMDGIAFSAQNADEADLSAFGFANGESLVGRAKPDQYSADLSLYVFEAGLKILQTQRPEILYLSTSDYVQHKYAPGTAEADDFHRAVDHYIAAMVACGATVALTADHGMAPKSDGEGRPNVTFVQDEIEGKFGAGSVRVICPIADPFVKHHGALGGFVRVHLLRSGDVPAMMEFVRGLPGVELVLDRETVCERFDLPLDREGDFAVFAGRDGVLGARRIDHDLSNLEGHLLRSHGGLGEQNVPFIISCALNSDYRASMEAKGMRNFDIFDAVLNGLA
ncbi:phosphonoacetate hydrolase [Novosphingobium fluoreni]|uniref:phosphonoacetate hydrolase n=1 Tax=Novosphingobium fluoreni TaxID=1391222 RepID=UPI00160F152D|nr:phosphonoacetate hydrolase [Novosphingobium fluoreni]